MAHRTGSACLLLTAVVATLLVACDSTGEGAAELPPCDWAEVMAIVDGDTIRVAAGDGSERVRYTGIDAPEMARDGEPAEPFADAATERNAELLEDGRVCLERDVSDRDRFDRLLRYIWLEDGTLVNETLLREGLAHVVTFPPDVRYHESRFEPAEAEARAAGRGIWSE